MFFTSTIFVFPILRGKKYFGPGNGGRAGVGLGSASGIFRHTQTYLNLEYRWNIQNPGIFLSLSLYRLQGLFIIPY